MELPSYEEISSKETTLRKFSDALALLFEPAPALFDKLYAQRERFDSYNSLLTYTQDVLLISIKQADRVSVLNAHPRLGAPATSLSSASKAEQGSDNDPQVLEELAHLNAEYEKKFPGIRFVTFVNGRSRRDIIPELKERLHNEDFDDEVQKGLDDMVDIARDRLKKLGQK